MNNNSCATVWRGWSRRPKATWPNTQGSRIIVQLKNPPVWMVMVSVSALSEDKLLVHIHAIIPMRPSASFNGSLSLPDLQHLVQEPPGLHSLPTELQIQISSFLPYPDALALKHTNRHFYNLVQTGIWLKVSWLLDRKRLNLEWPAQSCNFKTDESFCIGKVRDLMKKRREHRECSSTGCKVVEGTLCKKRKATRVAILWRGWTRRKEEWKLKGSAGTLTSLDTIIFIIAVFWMLASTMSWLSWN